MKYELDEFEARAAEALRLGELVVIAVICPDCMGVIPRGEEWRIGLKVHTHARWCACGYESDPYVEAAQHGVEVRRFPPARRHRVD